MILMKMFILKKMLILIIKYIHPMVLLVMKNYLQLMIILGK